MNQQSNLFGEVEAPRVHIDNNQMLAQIANHVLELVQRDSQLLTGDTVGEINRKVTLAVYWDNGLSGALGSKEKFAEWFLNRKLAHTEEEIARALRWLVAADYCRLPKSVIEKAENHRQRISRSLK